ncbi:hypothetical protein [Dokdonella sp.]|uniref:hypothetical protein n=1 Tax=Dokdonella sp. TaxID=2291710 RepID=UPI0035294723
MSLFTELKRRNVIRMAGLYLIGSWLIVQVAETVLPAFDVPAWVLRATIILLAIGFIPALIFSWVFELTPKGIRRESEVDRSQGVVDHTARKLDIAVIVLMLGLGAFFVWQRSSAPESNPSKAHVDETQATVAEPADNETSTSEIAEASVAVLPFVNMSADADNEYFADGISEELLNVLSRIDGLKVASRTSAFTFKGKDIPIPEIARSLGVRHVLEGSVRKQGQKVRITAQLIHAGSDGHQWSQSYDRELTDIFQIQEEIAQAIASELSDVIGPTSVSVDAPTTNLVAYERFLRGRARFNRRAELLGAMADLEFAVEQDPEFTDAWIFLAATNFVFSGYSDELSPSKTVAAAKTALARAAQLNPDHPLVLAIQGELRADDGEWAEAMILEQRASELSTQDSTPVLWYGQSLMAAGYIDESIKVLERAVLMEPQVGINHGSLAIAYFSAGQFERGVASARAGTANGWEGGQFVQMVELAVTGRRQQAAELVFSNSTSIGLSDADRKGLNAALRDPDAIQTYLANRTYKGPPEDLLALGMGERIFDWINEAQPQDAMRWARWMLRTLWLPSTRWLREDPRFMQWAESYGLIELWEQRGYPPGCQRVNDAKGDHLDCSGQAQ